MQVLSSVKFESMRLRRKKVVEIFFEKFCQHKRQLAKETKRRKVKLKRKRRKRRARENQYKNQEEEEKEEEEVKNRAKVSVSYSSLLFSSIYVRCLSFG